MKRVSQLSVPLRAIYLYEVAEQAKKSHIGTVSQLQCTTEHYCTCYQNEGYATYHSGQEDLGQTILPDGQRAAFSKSLSAYCSTPAKDGRPAVQIQQGLAAKPSFLQVQSKTANGR